MANFLIQKEDTRGADPKARKVRYTVDQWLLPPSDQEEEMTAVPRPPAVPRPRLSRGRDWEKQIAALEKCAQKARIHEGLFWKELPEDEIEEYAKNLRNRNPKQKSFMKRGKRAKKDKFHVVGWSIESLVCKSGEIPALKIVVCATGKDTKAKGGSFDPDTQPTVFYIGIIPANCFSVKIREDSAEKFSIKFQRRLNGKERAENEDFFLNALTDKTMLEGEESHDGITKLKLLAKKLHIDKAEGFIGKETANKNSKNKGMGYCWHGRTLWQDPVFMPEFQKGTLPVERRKRRPSSSTMKSESFLPSLKAKPSYVSMTFPKLSNYALSTTEYDELEYVEKVESKDHV